MSNFSTMVDDEAVLNSGSLGRFHTHLRILHANRSKARDYIYLELLWHGPISIAALTKQLHGRVSRATVYNTLRAFNELNVSDRLSSGEIELTDRFKQHHHYLICRNCGRRSGFYDRPLEQTLIRFAGRRNFALEAHILELEGVCRYCQGQGTEPRQALGASILRSPGR